MTRTSVVIPTFDRAALLPAAIDSVLAQVAADDEVIVVDDGSTDATAEVLRAYAPRLLVIRQARGGAAAARNVGVEAARGDRLAFLDSDDLWDVRHQPVLHGLLDRDPTLDLAFGHAAEFAEGPGGRRELRHLPAHCCGGLLGRRSSFAAVGAFRTDLRVGEFIDWMARARRCGRRDATAEAVVLHRRVHPGNMTRRGGAARGDYAAVLRRHLAAKRGEGP